MYIITKQFSFEAAHQLAGLPREHQCSRQHGHSYRVEVELSADKLNYAGFVVDYGELDAFASYLKGTFDHRDLNEVVPREWAESLSIRQTTAENLARGFFVWCKYNWPQTRAVRVSETQKTWAEYRP